MEERLVSDSRYVPNAMSYILEVHAVLKDNARSKSQKFYLQQINEILGDRLFIYSNGKDALLLNKRKAMDKSVLEGEAQNSDYTLDFSNKFYNAKLESYIALFERSVRDHLDKDTKTLLDTIISYPRDCVEELENLVYRFKFSDKIDQLVQFWKKFRLRNAKQAISFLVDKWS